MLFLMAVRAGRSGFRPFKHFLRGRYSEGDRILLEGGCSERSQAIRDRLADQITETQLFKNSPPRTFVDLEK
jgi:hypothetical protein